MSRASVNEVAKFLEHAVDELINGGGGTWYMPLNDYLDLDVGWMPGYGPEDWADGWDEAICAGIVVNDDMPDIEWATMPYADNGDVWDTCMALDCENEDYVSTAQWYVDQANEIMKAVESGEYKIPGYEPKYESKRFNERINDKYDIDYALIDSDDGELSIEDLIAYNLEGALDILRNQYEYDVNGFTTRSATREDVSDDDLIAEYSGIGFYPEDFGAYTWNEF